tara:strand:+ start:39 stop:470 length:432 start_codon:yes stop_codon:yes gene_type:complete
MDYENPWTFEGTPFTDNDIGDFFGFVYMITNLTDMRKYIGRKYFYTIRKQKGKTRRVRKISDWKDYYGSSDELKEDIEKIGKNNFKRMILSLHKTKGDVNYNEVKEQFLNNVLEDDTFYNNNINGKWHRVPQHIMEARRIAWQ